MMNKKRNRFKKLGKQDTFCSLPFKEYESMTPTQQFSFEKANETERRWFNFNLEVCHIYDREKQNPAFAFFSILRYKPPKLTT
jgi:hypothetical protein